MTVVCTQPNIAAGAAIQYFPLPVNLGFCNGNKPSLWQIGGYYNSTPTNTTYASGSPSNTFNSLLIKLIYNGLTSFNLSGSVGLLSNSISLSPFAYTISNTVNASRRTIANFSIYSQETFNGIAASMTWKIPTTFNNYGFTSNIVYNSCTNCTIQIPKSTYQNPSITFQLNGTVQRPYFYAPLQTYCPSTVANGAASNYKIGLADTNGSKYSFYIYTSAGSTAAGYILYVNELNGVTSQGAESLLVPGSLPMPVPLETTAQTYQFIVYNPTCTTVYYHGGFVDPTSPTYLTLTVGQTQAVIYNMTNVTGECLLNSTANPYKLSCVAADSTSQVYKYVLSLYNETNVLGNLALVKTYTFNTSSFSFNTVLPVNLTYSYSLYAYAFRRNDPVFLVNGGLLSLTQGTLSTPLLGIFAFILLLVLILIGIQSGKLIVLYLLVDVGLFIINILGLEEIPTIAAVFFIAIGAIIAFWSIKVR